MLARILRRVYRLALHLYPPSVRRRDGPEMERLFVDMVDGATGRVAALATAFRILAEAPLSAARAHGRVWGRSMLEGALLDFRVALRVLRRNPHFTLAAVLTLTVGIGGTTAMFSVLRGTLLRPPPFPDPDRIAVVHMTHQRAGEDPRPVRWSYPELESFTSAVDFAEETASFVRAGFNVATGERAVHVAGEVVSPGYLDVLGVEPLLGRGFGSDADQPGASQVALLGHDLWQRLYGGDPSVVGRDVRVSRVPLTVVGVMPPGFRGLSDRAELWVSHAAGTAVYYDELFTDHQHFLTGVVRLRPGVSMAEAAARTATVGGAVAVRAGHEGGGAWAGTARPLARARIDPGTRRSQLLLFGAVVLVLLIGCVNLANILLARTASRRRELATRMALGSSTGRLVRQLLVEGVALALVGGALGVVVAYLGTDLLAGLVPEVRPSAENDFAQIGQLAEVRLDTGVLLFAGAVSVATGLGLGILPALWARRAGPGDVLHQAGSTGSGGGSRAGRRLSSSSLLVAGEFALTLVLLVGAGLLGASWIQLQSRELGVDPQGVVVFSLRPGWGSYQGGEASDFVRRVLESVRSIPGVTAASVGPCTPMTRCATRHLFTGADVGRAGDGGASASAPLVRRHYVGPEHFETLGVELLRGRALTADDRRGAPRVTVVGRTAAQRFWPGGEALGRRVWFDEAHVGVPDSAFQVVGVVEDVRYASPDEPHGADFYTSYLQFARAGTLVMVRSERSLGELVPELRDAVAAVDPTVPVTDVTSLSSRLREPLERSRSTTLLLLGFAAVALVLAALGVYGVMTQFVVGRRKEMGIRLALGAGRGGVVRLILARALALVAAGLGAGLVAALLGSRFLRSFLYGVQPADPRVLTGSVAILLLTAFLASYLPARAATKVEPREVLGVEG